MKMSRNTNSGVNAGSMADIAFLLLIFFLVTTTFTEDEGIKGVIPKPCPEGVDCNSEIRERNIFTIQLNQQDELLANNELISLEELREDIKAFVDNNGDSSCAYCNGSKDKHSSENPQKAVISIKTDRRTSYNTYISVQNELMGAYFELRKELSKQKFNKAVEDLTEEELKILQESYPFRITEAKMEE
ncbi:biopolymer transport protein ExbD [Kordia periserrulae]|uniref:Biopolymer transport protein ExbD n=1 Tax=Kordia periserrulae TaxID=701523 RepID=A0A2T6BZI6_9FLAO|nr:biopolymer transporter ExbD [Kordia periserrulae]PTX61480.1 biopolymer transport protein ExbD [Kordia periserrulae]